MKERLLLFLTHLDIGQTKFELKVGLSRGLINKIKSGIHPNSLKKIKKEYPELNTTWLITGEGEMLLRDPIESHGAVSGQPANHKVDNIRDKDALIAVLQDQLNRSNNYYDKLLDMYETKLEKLYANSLNVLDNQQKIKTEISVAFRLIVQQIVGADNEDKLEEISNEFDTLLTAALH